MATLPLRQSFRQPSRQVSTDPHNDLNIQMDHYIGIDVGTGSARACVIDGKGDIIGLASENIGLWQPEHGYYVRDTLQSLSLRSHLLHLSMARYINIMTRNNPPITSGKPFASRSSEYSPSTTSMPPLYGAWLLMQPAHLRSFPMILMSLSP